MSNTIPSSSERPLATLTSSPARAGSIDSGYRERGTTGASAGTRGLAERLAHPTTRVLARDTLKLASTEARRRVEADPELDDYFAEALALLL